MGSFLSILIALGVLAAEEYGLETGWRAPWALPFYLLLPYGLASLARSAFLRGRFASGERWQRAIGASSVFSFASAVLALGWMGALEAWLGRDISFFDWPRLEVLLVLLPFVLYEVAAIDARSRLFGRLGSSRVRGFQVRMFLSTLVPLVVYVAISAAVGASPALRVRIEEVGAYHALYALLLVVLLVACLPLLLVRALDTRSIPDGALRRLFEEVGSLARFRARDIYVWNTGGNMANAAIIGLGARLRVVLFSDVLLAQLEPRELAAVYAHEIAHAKKHHVPVFAAWILTFFLGGDLVARAVFPHDEWLASAALLVSVGGWFLFFGWLSRRYELEADLYAIELLGDPAAMISALERVGGDLRDVASWRHFSTARRVEFLARSVGDPGLGKRLVRQLRVWSWTGIGSFTLCAALHGMRLAQCYDSDRLRACLRLGEYAEASALAAKAEDLEHDLALLVERARSIGHDVTEPAELEASARAALARDDLQAALEFLELGHLRGHEELGDVALALLDPRHTLEPGTAQRWERELDQAARLLPQSNARPLPHGEPGEPEGELAPTEQR